MGLVDKAREAAEKMMGGAKEAMGQHGDDQGAQAGGQQNQVVDEAKNAAENAKDTLNG